MFTEKLIALPRSSSLYIVLSFLFSWLAWLPAVLCSRGLIDEVPWLPILTLGTCGPLVAALWCTWITEGSAGVKEWLKNGFRQQIHWRLWLLIILLPFLIPALVWTMYHWGGGGPFSLAVFHNPWVILPTILLMVTIGGGQEEYGWRGYLLPHLESRWEPWQADLIMILVHTTWHLPLFFIPAAAQSNYPFWVFLAFGSGFTLTINRIYRATGGSMLAAVMFHGMVNTGLDTFPLVGAAVGGDRWPFILAGLCYALLAMIIRPRRVTT